MSTTVSSVNPFASNDEQSQIDKKKPTVKQSQDINIYGNASATRTQASTNNENLGLVSQEALDSDADMGLSIQRSTTPQATQTAATVQIAQAQKSEQAKSTGDVLEIAADDPVWAENAARNQKTKKPSFTKTLETFYGKRYTEASPEERERLAVKYFDWIRSDKKDVISQARQFELYKSRCESAEEYEFLCSVIDKMAPDQQAKAVKSVTTEGSDGQKAVGVVTTTRDMDRYDKSSIDEIRQSIQEGTKSLPARYRIAVVEQLYKDIQYSQNVAVPSPADMQQSGIFSQSIVSSQSRAVSGMELSQAEGAESSQKSRDIKELTADDPIWAQNAENNKKTRKPSFTNTLEAFYGKRYTEASPEERERLAVKYFDWIRSDKKDVISQSRQFELYKQRCESPEEYEFLCSVIDKMAPDQQVKAVKSVTTEGTHGQRAIGVSATTRDMDNYDKGSIEEIRQTIQDATKDLPPEYRVAAVDQLYNDIQMRANGNPHYHTEMAATLHGMEMDISNDESFSREERVHHGRRAQSITQYAYEDQQQGLIDAGYASELVEVQTATAEYTKTYDKSVQKYSVDRGLELGNEDIANIFARDVYSYDESVREDIINTLNNSNYDSVKETLKESKAKYEAEQQAKAEESKDSSTTSTAEEKVSESAVSESEKRITSIVKNNSTNTTQKAKQIKTLNPKEQHIAIGKMIETSTMPEIKSLALSGLKTEVVNYLLDNYSPDNSSILEHLNDIMTSAEKQRYEEVKNKYLNKHTVTNFFIR